MVCDDHALFRRGVISLLREQGGVDVVGEAGEALEAIALARKLEPDLVLMDVHMPGVNGIEATRRLREECPKVKVVVLTVEEDDESLFAAIRAGAQGYLLKDLQLPDLVGHLQAVHRGEAALSPGLAGRLLGEFARVARDAVGRSAATALTGREVEVLRLVASGAANKEIAVRLGISENTVKRHLQNILDKLHLQNRYQAAAYAMRHGLVQKGE